MRIVKFNKRFTIIFVIVVSVAIAVSCVAIKKHKNKLREIAIEKATEIETESAR